MGRPKGWASDQTGRPVMRSPGRPPVGRREHRQRFLAAIARGLGSDAAGIEAGSRTVFSSIWRVFRPSLTAFGVQRIGPVNVIQRKQHRLASSKPLQHEFATSGVTTDGRSPISRCWCSRRYSEKFSNRFTGSAVEALDIANRDLGEPRSVRVVTSSRRHPTWTLCLLDV